MTNKQDRDFDNDNEGFDGFEPHTDSPEKLDELMADTGEGSLDDEDSVDVKAESTRPAYTIFTDGESFKFTVDDVFNLLHLDMDAGDGGVVTSRWLAYLTDTYDPELSHLISSREDQRREVVRALGLHYSGDLHAPILESVASGDLYGIHRLVSRDELRKEMKINPQIFCYKTSDPDDPERKVGHTGIGLGISAYASLFLGPIQKINPVLLSRLVCVTTPYDILVLAADIVVALNLMKAEALEAGGNTADCDDPEMRALYKYASRMNAGRCGIHREAKDRGVCADIDNFIIVHPVTSILTAVSIVAQDEVSNTCDSMARALKEAYELGISGEQHKIPKMVCANVANTLATSIRNKGYLNSVFDGAEAHNIRRSYSLSLGAGQNKSSSIHLDRNEVATTSYIKGAEDPSIPADKFSEACLDAEGNVVEVTTSIKYSNKLHGNWLLWATRIRPQRPPFVRPASVVTRDNVAYPAGGSKAVNSEPQRYTSLLGVPEYRVVKLETALKAPVLTEE